MSAGVGRPVQRRCVSCRTLLDRRDLWRVVRLAAGGISLDEGMGRSAYLCRQAACLEEARRRRRLQKSLRCTIDESILLQLQARLEQSEDAGAEAR